jgi:hypothetical protein
MLPPLTSVLILLAAGQLGVSARKFVIKNSCKGEVWAAYTATQKFDVTVNGKSGIGSWHQASGQEDTLEVPETCRFGVLVELYDMVLIWLSRRWKVLGCDGV